MKKLFFSLVFMCAAFVVSAQTVALPGSYRTIIGGGTNKAVALSTNAYFEINNEQQTDLAFFIDFKYLNAVGAGDVNRLDMEVFRGIGSGVYESNVWQTISFAAASTTTTARSTVTNLSFSAVPSIRCRFLNLSTNAHATNITVLVRPKEIRTLQR